MLVQFYWHCLHLMRGTPDLESVNNIKMLPFSTELFKTSHCGMQNLILVLFKWKKNTLFFPISMNIYSNANRFLKFHFPGQAINSCATGVDIQVKN